MKILQIFNRYLERGGEEIFVDFFTAEAGACHEIRNLVFQSADWKSEPAWKKVLQPLRMIHNPDAIRKVEQAVRDFAPDITVVHNVFPVGSLAVYSTLARLGVPIVQYIHNFRPFSVNSYCWADGALCPAGLRKNFLPEILHGSWQDSRIKTAIYAGVLWIGHLTGTWGKVTRWVAISHFMKEKFVLAGIPAERIDVVSHCLDKRDSPLEPADEPAEPTLLFLGRLTEEKGLRTLAAAWKKVENKRPTGRLVIAGQGPLAEWLHQELASCHRVSLPGFITGEAKERLLSTCSALIVPSQWWEPFGLVVLEAYRFGKPVLAAAEGGLTETVVEGATGWLHPSGNVLRLASQIEAVLDDPEEASRRGAEGRRWLEQNANAALWRERITASLSAAAAARLRSPSSGTALKPERIAAVFATMNRKETAVQCVLSLAAQTVPVGKLIAVDNSSSDGTAEALQKACSEAGLTFEILPLEENLGNAGGIRVAMDRAFQQGFDAVWILDDDSWPETGAFEGLLAEGPPAGIRTSTVLASDSDHLSWPCEILGPDNAWEFATAEIDLHSAPFLRVRRSWLGALVTKAAYDTVGPINADLFLRGEDEDYPRRLENAGCLFWMMPRSILRHPISGPLITLSFGDYKLSLERNLHGDKLYYRIRNMLWIKTRESGSLAAIVLAAGYLALIFRWLRPLSSALSVFFEAAEDAAAGRLGKRNPPREAVAGE